MDFYLWGTLKDKVYHTEVTSLELVQRITNSIKIRQNVQKICDVISFIRHRCEACINVQG